MMNVIDSFRISSGRRAASVLSAALDLIYPRQCSSCGNTVVQSGAHLCWDCLAKSEFISDPYCSLCGDPVDGAVHHRYICGWCLETKPAFTNARSAVRFRGSMKSALLTFKYRHSPFLGRDLGALLAACCNVHYHDISFDCVTGVPLYSAKMRHRSYNQANVLAKHFSVETSIPFEPRCLVRIRHTQTQTKLNARQRKVNVHNAFEVQMPNWIKGRRILLVDDVMTTGATVNECAVVLMKAGALSVHVLTVARG